MTTIVSGSQITFNDNTTQNTSAYGGGFAMRNRIINGDCRIDQRNAGASVTQGTGTLYTLDRFACIGSAASKFSVQQSTTAPTGFNNSLLVTSLSSYTVGASERFGVWQIIEGYNIADLGWGTANAKTVTLSFVVRSSLTGQFGGVIYSSNRFYPFSYTISSANTWETKTITITGSTDGTWATDNSAGMVVYFNMGAGASQSATAGSWGTSSVRGATGDTSVVGTNGATFYITGVQLEKGSTATSFDYRPYGQELALCQRYCVAFTTGVTPYITGQVNSNKIYAALPQAMRSSPSATYNAINANDTSVSNAITAIAIDGSSLSSVGFNVTSSGLTSGRCGMILGTGSTSYLIFSAEL